MKSSGRFVPFFILFTVSFFFLNVSSLLAQDASQPVLDSARAETIDMADITIESLEVIQKSKRITGSLITEEELQQLTNENDSLVSLVDSIFQKDNGKNLNMQSSRKLENKIAFWKQEQTLLEEQIAIITAVLHDLDESKFTLSREVSKWKLTDEQVDDMDFADAVHERIDVVLKTLDTTLNTIKVKSGTALLLLNQTSTFEGDISARIDKIESVLLNKQQTFFISNQNSFFSIGYTDKSNWNVSEPVGNFYRVELRNLKNYLGMNVDIVFFHLLLIILLIALFIYLNKTHIKVDKIDDGLFYKKRLKVVLSRPVSAALIIGLFASVLLYPNRPLIFNDLMRFLVIFPIVLVLSGILHRKYHIYVYALGIVILLQIMYINLPAANIISRIILLFIALIELGAIGHFVLYYKRRADKKDKLTSLILAVSYIYLAMTVIGLVGNMLGKVMLAEFFLFAVAGNALTVTLIALSLIVVNGFVVLFIEGKYAGKFNVVRNNRSLLINKVTRLFNIAAIVILIYYFLKILGWETTVMDGIFEWFIKERNIGSMVFSWSSLFVFFFVIWLSIVVAKIVRAILEDDVLNKMKLDKGLPHTISMMVRYTLVTAGIFLAVSAAGFPMSEFAIIFGAFGVGIGFGLQNIFNNLVSGLILLFERPIKIGDTIEVGTLMGNVKSIGIRSSNVRTFDGAEIIVPNGNLISNEVVNWTLSDQTRRIEVIVGVSYSSDPHQVHDILLKILKEHKDIVNDPEPNVFFRDLGSSSLDFRMLFWTTNFDQWIRIRSEIIFNVFDALKAAGIEIPFPQHDLHLRSVDKSATIAIRNKNE